MNPTRQSKLDGLETIRQAEAEYRDLSPAAQIRVKLGRLQAFIEQLSQTPHGQAELADRTRAFGPCVQAIDESNGRYYGRLRRWLDADLITKTSASPESTIPPWQ